MDCILLKGSHQNLVTKLWEKEQASDEADGLSKWAELNVLISCSVTTPVTNGDKGCPISLVIKCNKVSERDVYIHGKDGLKNSFKE